MADDLTFLMGKFPARLPGDLRYARNHMWCREGGGRDRFGFSAYAVRLMQDVYFLDWQVSPGDAVQLKQQVGHIETALREPLTAVTQASSQFTKPAGSAAGPARSATGAAGSL